MASDTGMQVAKANVGIFPVLNGVRAAIENELKASGKAGATAFDKSFSGRKLGSSAGKDVAAAFDQATRSLGEQAFRGLTQEAAKASAAVSKAREQQRSSAAQVQIAEQKLAETIEKYGEDSSQAMQAQERLTAAQRKSETAADNLTAAQERLEKARKAVYEAIPTSGDAGTEWLSRQTETLTAQVTQQRDRLAKADDAVAAAERRLADAMQTGETSSKKIAQAQAGLEAAKTRQRNASERLSNTERELDRVQTAASQSTDQVAASMRQGADATELLKRGADAAGEAFTGIRKKIADATGGVKDFVLGAAGIAGIGATIGGAIQSGIEQANLSGTLIAALGDEQAAKEAGNAIGEVYAEGWGESLDQVKEAALQTKQTIRDIDEEDLTTVTRNALVLADVFDADVNESVRGTNALMKGFGLTATEASDLLAAGMQRGLNYTDELGDNLAEYSVRWGEAGMSASKYFSLLQAGTDNGAYNLDKVGDYLNEFLTSLSDGRMEESIGSFSQGTKEIFDNFKNGKATAEEVLNAVIADLKSMTTEQERATTASTLWSSLGEDNAMGMILALGDVEDSYNDVAGAASDMAKNNASIQQSWERVVRSISQNVGKKLAPMLQDLAGRIEDEGPKIADTVENIAGVAIDLVDAFTDLPGPVQIAVAGFVLFGNKIGGIVSTAKTVGKAVTDLVGVLRKSGGDAETAAPKISGLGTQLQTTGKHARNAGKDIGQAGIEAQNAGTKASGAGKGFNVLGGAIGGLAIGVGLTALATLYDELTEGEKKADALSQAMEQGGTAVDDFLTKAAQTGEGLNWSVWDTMKTGVSEFKDILDQANISSDTWTQAVQGSSGAIDAYNMSLAEALSNGQLTLEQWGAGYDELIEMQEAYQQAAWQQNQMVGSTQSLQTLQTGLNSTMSQLNTTIMANGATLDETTQSGQLNRQAMQQLADQSIVTAQAILQQGQADGNMAQASQDARNQIYQARQAMIDAAIQCGMSEEAANQYADSLGLIPGNVGTTITENAPLTESQVRSYLDTLNLTPQTKDTVMNAYKDGAINNINDVNQAIRNVPQEKTTDMKVNGTQQAVSNLSNVMGWLNAIPGVKTVKVVAQAIGTGISKLFGRADGGIVKRAQGGPVRLASGGGPSGYVRGPGTTTSDSIPTLLSDREFVIRASSARRIGIGNLERMNATGTLPATIDPNTLAKAIAQAIATALADAGVGANVTQTFNYPAIAPTVLSTNQKLDLAAMPQW